MKYTFSGHDSFQCRQLWLKKGHDYIKSGKSFNDEDAVVLLGVGKNMVSSIRFWMKAFGLLTIGQYTKDDKLTPFANKLLDENGWDPFLEDEASLWLLHYQLVKNAFASTYSIIFNELRREKIEFTRKNFVTYAEAKAKETGEFNVNEKTLQDDFNVMTKMYVRSSVNDKEDSYSGILTELDLMKVSHRKKEDFFLVENTDKLQMPDEVFLYALLEINDFDLSISLNTLEQEPGNVGSIFALNRTGLFNKIENLCSKNKSSMVYNDHAGIKELQFKEKPLPLTVLDRYYAN